VADYPCGADSAHHGKDGAFILFLEQPDPWNDTEPTDQIIPRVFGCLKCVKEGEAERFSGSKRFRIRVVYHHEPPRKSHVL